MRRRVRIRSAAREHGSASAQVGSGRTGGDALGVAHNRGPAGVGVSPRTCGTAHSAIRGLTRVGGRGRAIR